MVKYGVLYEQGFRAKKNVENRTLKTWPLRKIVYVILYYTRRFFMLFYDSFCQHLSLFLLFLYILLLQIRFL